MLNLDLQQQKIREKKPQNCEYDIASNSLWFKYGHIDQSSPDGKIFTTKKNSAFGRITQQLITSSLYKFYSSY